MLVTFKVKKSRSYSILDMAGLCVFPLEVRFRSVKGATVLSSLKPR